MKLNEELKSASVSQLIRWWNGDEIPEWSKDTALFLPKTGHALSLAGSQGVEFLRTQIKSNDLNKRAIALNELADPRITDAKTVQYLVDAFVGRQADDPEIIINGFKTLALNGFIRIEQYPLGRQEVECLLKHSDRWLAAAAMVYLSRAFEDEAIEILQVGLESSNSVMRAYACTEAGFRNIRPLKEKVALLLKDTDQYVANSAQIGCEMFEIVYDVTC